jgi:RNA polymerase sigma-70 factor (ECF subfamily)
MDQDPPTYYDESIRLMRKITEDDPEAFERLYDKYGSLLEQILAGYDNHHMSTEDFIQEVFTRLWQQRKNFRGQSHILTYLLGIARNTVNEEIRRSGKMTVRNLKEEMYTNMDSHHDLTQPEAELFLKELTTVLEKIRACLTAKQRQALDISQKSDGPLCQVSKRLCCSHEAFRSRLKRARKRSQELLAAILQDE